MSKRKGTKKHMTPKQRAELQLKGWKFRIGRLRDEWYRVQVELARVRGILDSTQAATNLATLRHQMRSVIGHRRVIRRMTEQLLDLMTAAMAIDTDLG